MFTRLNRDEIFECYQAILDLTDDFMRSNEINKHIPQISTNRLAYHLSQLEKKGYLESETLMGKKGGFYKKFKRIKFYKAEDYILEHELSDDIRKREEAELKRKKEIGQVVYANKYDQLSGDFIKIQPAQGRKATERHIKAPIVRPRVFVGSVYNGMML